MRPYRSAMLQLLLCLLLVACLPTEKSPSPWRGAATVHEVAGPRGTRKPSKPPKKNEPNEPGTRPVSKNRCLDSAAAGGVVWTTFCRDIKDANTRKRCFELGLESEQRRQGFCYNFF